MINKIKKIIKIEDFLAEERIYIKENELYGKRLTNLCNNACAFIYLKLLDNFELEELESFELNNGYYLSDNNKTQHSWLYYKPDNIIIDLTLKQFSEDYEDLFIDKKPIYFLDNKKINCADIIRIAEFIESL